MKRSLPLLLALAPAALFAQDPQLSQFFAAPMYLNPALTGNTYQDRIAMNYRNQWPSAVTNAFQTYAASYDHRSPKLNSGFGVMAIRDVAGSNGLAFTQVAAAYSYEARIDRKSAFRGGVRAAWTNRSYDPNSFLFADQVIRDNAATSIESGFVQQVNYMDLSAGGLYYNERFWAGFSVNHLNRPQQSLFLNGDARLPMRTSVHTGYRFPLDGERMAHSNTVGTFATHYKAQGKWDQFDVGFYVDHDKLTAGLWYRGIPGLKAYAPGYPNSDAVVLMAGYETPAATAHRVQLRRHHQLARPVQWWRARGEPHLRVAAQSQGAQAQDRALPEVLSVITGARRPSHRRSDPCRAAGRGPGTRRHDAWRRRHPSGC